MKRPVLYNKPANWGVFLLKIWPNEILSFSLFSKIINTNN